MISDYMAWGTATAQGCQYNTVLELVNSIYVLCWAVHEPDMFDAELRVVLESYLQGTLLSKTLFDSCQSLH